MAPNMYKEPPTEKEKAKFSEKFMNTPTAPEMNEKYENLLRDGVDARGALSEAFGNDADMMSKIDEIVRQLDGLDGNSTSVDKTFREKQLRHDKQKGDLAEQAAARRAQDQADDWLEQGLRKGRAAEDAALKAARDAARDAAQKQNPVHNEASSENKRRIEDEVARLEADKRAALFEMAALRVAESKEVHPSSSSVMHGVPPPARIPEPGGAADELPKPPSKAELEEERKKNPIAIPPFYKILGVNLDATFEEIKKAYRREALKWHPDKNRDKLEAATEHFKKITEAFDTLFDPKRREDYDSGNVKGPKKAKKLQGAGWAKATDEDDSVLTPHGVKIKKQSWRTYVQFYGRIDDDPDKLVQFDTDPRAPEEKKKIFWRSIGEYGWSARDEGYDDWLPCFIQEVWKDTPDRWPKALELQKMNDAARQEWKERRMVYNRRKEKVLLAIEMHERYLAIPNREKKEKERLLKMYPAFAKYANWTV